MKKRDSQTISIVGIHRSFVVGIHLAEPHKIMRESYEGEWV